jgi:DNA primase
MIRSRTMLIDYRAVRAEISMQRVLGLTGYHPTSRRGHQLRGACPFHTSKSPNPRCFSVELKKGVFRCFTCGAKGNQLDLWAQLRSLPLHKAAIDLCHHAGIRIPTINSDSTDR